MSEYRHEYKYLLDPLQESLLKLKAAAVMNRDPHVRRDGSYLIRSVYFDDAADTCLAENAAGADPRSKFRLRRYNDDVATILLEKKSKRRGMCRKESCAVTAEECEQLLRGEIPVPGPGESERKRRLLAEMLLRGLRPVTIVTYERTPFVYSGGNVRVTFDRKLASSPEVTRFLEGNYLRRPVFAAGQSLLEVKWDEVMPRHLKEVLQLDTLLWTAFSKYYMCRTIHL